MGATVLAVAAIATTAVGAGVSYYGAQQQADATRAAAEYNAQVQRNNALLAAQQAQAQYSKQAAIAENQAAWMSYNQQLSRNNAKALQDQAANERLVAQENARRQRGLNERELARMRARMAASGVNISEGSPLNLQEESAELLELRVLEIGRQAEMRVQTLNYQSLLEEADAARKGTEVGLANLRADNARFNLSTSKYIADIGESKANLTLLEGQNRAQGIRYGAYGDALSSAGNIATSGYNYLS